jgi:two-component system, sensor histidine kinase and response regulator
MVERILVVDDDQELLATVSRSLQRSGYECVVATRGDDALAELETSAVDLAIIDLRLPEMDGVDLARAIKERVGHGEFLPVMVITGSDGLDERVRALNAGCDDFLAKPIHIVEMQARVRSLLVRRRQHAELARANAQLKELQRRKQDLAALVVHDLRNPLSAIQGNLELLFEELENPRDFVRDALNDCHKLAGRALFLVASLLDVEELSEGLLRAEVQDVPIARVVGQCTPHHDATIRMRDLTLDLRVSDELRGLIDPDLVSRLVENLLDNSVRYAPRGGLVVVAAAIEGGQLVVRVGNNGPPVPDAERERIFGRYYRLEARRAGARANRGLGLYFCKLAAEAHGGSIEIEVTEELPACFVLRIPQPPRISA